MFFFFFENMHSEKAQLRLNTLARHLDGNATLTRGVAAEVCFVPPSNPGKVLEEERALATFPTRRLTYLLDGGEEWTLVHDQLGWGWGVGAGAGASANQTTEEERI